MIHPERKLVDTRDKISFSLPKTLEAKEEQIREQTISISCCCCAFQPRSFKIDVYCFEDFVVAREYALVGSIERSHRGRVSALSKQTSEASSSRFEEKREFCNRIADKKTKKKTSSGVPRTKTSRVFGRPFLRWTRRSRSKFAKPISRNVVASSFRSWRPTLSRSCEGWTGR